MSKRGLVLTAVSLLVCLQLQGEAVNNYIKRRFNGEDVQVRDIQGLAERIQDGKLHLYLRDFIELVLKNSPDVQLSRLDAYTQANQITAAENPFDPVLTASFQSQRAITPFAFGEGFGGIGTSGGGGGTSTGGSGNGNGTGVGGIVALPQTISSLTQTSTLDYKQLLPWGQSFETTFQGIRSSGDEYISPAVFGSLTFSVVQPLLQNRTNLQARGPLTVARTQLLISTEQDQARIADTVAQAAVQYWDAVQDRENIRVQQQSVSLVEKSYQRDKMALDLGALAALDIYQSETQVAERNRDLVQAKHLYRTALDQLRHLIGADLTPELRATEIVLEDDPSQLPPRGSILPFEQALNSAMQVRPEFRAAGQRIEVDELNAHIARDALLPQLSLSANGGSSGPAL
ncbi:MAG: TolC family protein, partial [Acidobacteriaceae bacterium]|nr:TolC family protein [Acidobacteriaceae bacterium]